MKLLLGISLVLLVAFGSAACDRDACTGLIYDLEAECCPAKTNRNASCKLADSKADLVEWCRDKAEQLCGGDEDRIAARVAEKQGNTCYIDWWCD